MRYPGIEPGPHRWQRRILTTELIARVTIIQFHIILFFIEFYFSQIRAPRIELGTYCVLGSRHNQLDQARTYIDKSHVKKFYAVRFNAALRSKKN